MANRLFPAAAATFLIRVAAAVVGSCAIWFPGGCFAQIEFRDVTAETGITFRHDDGHAGNYHIIEFLSAGLATFDYDGDGKIDIYFLNGRPLPGRTAPDPPLRNALYRNLGNWRFVDVTRQAGVDGGDGYGLGVVVGDYNNDGHPRPVPEQLRAQHPVPQQWRRHVYRRDSQGRRGRGNRAGAGACFLDIDEDGLLDLYVANYVQEATEPRPVQTRMGYPIYPRPQELQARTAPPLPQQRRRDLYRRDRGSRESFLTWRLGWG